jgi:hypothetical protein
VTPDTSDLSPLAFVIEALDLLGRAHTLQSRVVEANDAREIESRRDMSMTLSSAAKRWFAGLPFREGPQDSMTIMIVSLTALRADNSKLYIMRRSTS